LAPQDYHRFHSPVEGRIGEMTYIAGEYYTVNVSSSHRIEISISNHVVLFSLKPFVPRSTCMERTPARLCPSTAHNSGV
jgi:hypothetical protein